MNKRKLFRFVRPDGSTKVMMEFSKKIALHQVRQCYPNATIRDVKTSRKKQQLWNL